MQDMVRTEKRASGALRLFMMGALTMAAAVVANLVVRSIAFAIWPISATFLPLQVGSICVFTAVLVGGGVLVYALVVRFSRHPSRTFTMIALITLLLSLGPPVMLFFNPDTRMLPGVTPLAASILMVFHIMDALIAIVLLTRLAPSKGRVAHTT
jgi:heme/copper-type cytochrome/quinol oxidase subunit 3